MILTWKNIFYMALNDVKYDDKEDLASFTPSNIECQIEIWTKNKYKPKNCMNNKREGNSEIQISGYKPNYRLINCKKK